MLFGICVICRMLLAPIIEKIIASFGMDAHGFVYFGPVGVMIYFAYGIVIYYGIIQEQKEILLITAIAIYVSQSLWPFLDISKCSGLGLILVLIFYMPDILERSGELFIKLQKYTFPLFICHLSLMYMVDLLLEHIVVNNTGKVCIILILPFIMAIMLYIINQKIVKLLRK